MSRFVVEDVPASDSRFVVEDDTPDQKPESPFKTAGRSDPVRSVISTLQGPAMNWADEGLATVQAGIDRVTRGIPYGQARQQWLDYYRGASEQFGTDHPFVAPALQVGAAIGTGMGAKSLLTRAGVAVPTVASVINPTSVMGRIGTAATAGGLSGAIGGAGGSESLSDLPEKALLGGALGAATGAATSAIGQGVSAIGKPVVARFREKSAEELARERVAAALTRDGRTTDQTLARLNTLGPEAPLAVAGGKNTVDLLDTVATMPGRTSDDVERAIRAQQAGRAGRLSAAAEQGLGTNGARLSQTMTALDEARARAAAPLYDQVRSIGIPVDDELGRLLERARPAFSDAERLAKLRGVPFELPEAIRVAGEARRTTPTLSNMLTEKGPTPSVNVGQLDTLKRTLFDMEQANINPETGRLNEIGNALKDLRRAIVAKADDATRDASGTSLYEAARNAYAGPSEMRAAALAGAQVITKPGWKIDDLTANMGPAELEAFRVGAMQSLRDKLGREGGQTELLKMWKEPATQERLKAIFPDLRSYREFAAEVAKEARIKALESVGRGSQTAARQARMDDEAAAAMQAMTDVGSSLMRANPMGVVSGLRNLYGRTMMPEPVRDQIGSMLLTRGPQAQGLLGDLSRYADAEAARRAAWAQGEGLLSGTMINSLLSR